MKTVCGIVKIIETVMRVIVAVVAVVLILFAAYSLYDTFYINQHAFSSYELKQYKPVPVEDNDDDGSGARDKSSFDEILAINEDAAAWLTIFDTNIDYPVVQGDDDLEYASKDIYGKTSISGAIYLMTDNAHDFSDSYNVIFGHHMDNGAMFGDLEKYKKEDYFNLHPNGWIYAGDRYFTLDVFAVMLTDAYDQNVYNPDLLTIDERLDYIVDNSIYIREVSASAREALELYEKEGVSVLDHLQKSGGPALIVALSTCESAITNGRIVVFCMATPVEYSKIATYYSETGEDGGNESKVPEVIEKLTAIGHPFGADNWGFLNVVCVIYCLYVVLPFTKSKMKFYQSRAAKKAKELYSGYGYSGSDAMAIIRYGNDIKRKLKQFRTKIGIGTMLEILILIGTLVVFFLTQDLTAPVVMCDKFTPVMIAISALMFTVDVIFFVYRDIRIFTPEEVAQMNRPEGR
ncbi:MAG: class B sortase [Saccharofermentans sp.]|nr:class B sortase [Saccharofermentans sp.]